jgi:hypothetical protein
MEIVLNELDYKGEEAPGGGMGATSIKSTETSSTNGVEAEGSKSLREVVPIDLLSMVLLISERF